MENEFRRCISYVLDLFFATNKEAAANRERRGSWRMNLGERIATSREEIDHLSRELIANRTKFNVDTLKKVQEITELSRNFDYWCEQIEGRTQALDLIRNIHTMSDQNGRIPFGDTTLPMNQARIMLTQAYLVQNWSIADNITGYFGKVFCTPDYTYNQTNTVNLVSELVGKNRKKRTAALIGTSIRNEFGWPLAISYTLRNHFVHDGGIFGNGVEFFVPRTPPDKWFSMSNSAWLAIEKKAEIHATPDCVKPGADLPSDAEGDLISLLEYCEPPMDEALNTVFQLTTDFLKTQVSFLIRE